MDDALRVLAIIPARGGSKALPGKNIRPLAGKPLIGWTIEAAQRAGLVDHVILSSDDPKIIDAAKSFDCDVPFVRPPHLATDHALLADTLIHALDQVGSDYDYLVVLQPTSPLRIAEDIDGCISRCLEADAATCLTVTPAPKPPHWMFFVDDQNGMTPVMDWDTVNTPRHDLSTAWVLNGAVYVANIDFFRREKTLLNAETLAYPMPRERSVDIDTAEDFRQAAHLMEQAEAERYK